MNGPLTSMLEGLQGSMRSGKQAGLRGCWDHITDMNPGLSTRGLFVQRLLQVALYGVPSENSLTALWESSPTLPSEGEGNRAGG